MNLSKKHFMNAFSSAILCVSLVCRCQMPSVPSSGASSSRKSILLRPGMQVMSSHVFSLTFHRANKYTLKAEDGFTTRTLPLSTYRLPLPDFVVNAGVDSIWLLVPAKANVHAVRLNGKAGLPVSCASLPALAPTIAECAGMNAFRVDTSEREAVFEVQDAENIATSTPPASELWTMMAQTARPLAHPAGWFVADASATTELPPLHPLFDYVLRDTSLRPGANGEFFLTGSTGSPDMWAVTADIQLWRSSDLVHWSPVLTHPRARSVVWNIDRDGTWEKKVSLREGAPFRPLWAPEIHYLFGTYWIPYSIPGLGTGLLKSSTRRPEGPYVSALKVDAPLTTGIDASLFQDDDGSVYFLWAGGKIARLTHDMTALAETPRQLKPKNAALVGFEGSSLLKFKGRYYLSAADYTNGDYNCFTAAADSINGPYGDRYISVPHGGHNNFFLDNAGQLWSTFFGSDAHAPFNELPAIVPMHLDAHGELKPVT